MSLLQIFTGFGPVVLFRLGGGGTTTPRKMVGSGGRLSNVGVLPFYS